MAIGALAVLAGAGALSYWASTNVFQTFKISRDNARKLDLEWEQFKQQSDYLNLREDELEFEKIKWLSQYQENERDYLRSLDQTSMIAGFDQELQSQRLQLDEAQFQTQLNQEDIERNLYLQEKTFKSTQSFFSRYGSENDINKLSFIISELKNIQTQQDINTTVSSLPQTKPDYSEDPNFDYALWHPIPNE